MKKILIILFLMLNLDANMNFEEDLKCKKCHPTIYDEHMSAMHSKSTIHQDPIHKAVWDKHPLKKKGDYRCAKCHTPESKSLENEKGISCAYCHRIETVEHGVMSNINKIHPEEADYYGGVEDPVRNKFHYTKKSDIYTNGQVCMGCHSHKKNKAKLDVCVTDMGDEKDSENCITCHMPKVEGSRSTKEDSTHHAYHGFYGANSGHEMLSKYIDMKFIKKEKGFAVSIHNQSPHDLMLHPLRLTLLKVKIIRDEEEVALKDVAFVRVLGKDNKPAPPWLANAIIKNSMIKGKESREVFFDEELINGDKIEMELGFYLVNPKTVKKFALENNEKVKKFNTLKKTSFEVK